jgi:hypothetical protein
MWVRTLDLNVVCYDESFLLALASILGSPVKVNMNMLNVEEKKFTRIYIEIDLNQPVIRNVLIHEHWYKVEYERLHIICEKCGCYGHVRRKCLLEMNYCTNSLKNSQNSVGATVGGGNPSKIHTQPNLCNQPHN